MGGAISNAQRAALRRAIASHPDWPAYRRTHGVDTASLGAARAVDVARHLGLDVETLIVEIKKFHNVMIFITNFFLD